MTRMSNLYRLQQVEKDLDESRSRLQEIDRTLAEDQRVSEAEKAFEEAQDAYVKAKSQMGDAEQSVASQRTKIKETEEALYGGEVTNPKELQDLQRESEALKRYLSTLEDRMLDAMVELEEAEEEYEAAKKNLEQVRSSVATEHEDLTEERQELNTKLERLEEVLNTERNNVPENDLAVYEKLKRRVGGFPIAVADGGSCSVCGLSIPASKAQRIRSGNEIVRCEGCGRILYQG